MKKRKTYMDRPIVARLWRCAAKGGKCHLPYLPTWAERTSSRLEGSIMGRSGIFLFYFYHFSVLFSTFFFFFDSKKSVHDLWKKIDGKISHIYRTIIVKTFILFE